MGTKDKDVRGGQQQQPKEKASSASSSGSGASSLFQEDISTISNDDFCAFLTGLSKSYNRKMKKAEENAALQLPKVFENEDLEQLVKTLKENENTLTNLKSRLRDSKVHQELISNKSTSSSEYIPCPIELQDDFIKVIKMTSREAMLLEKNNSLSDVNSIIDKIDPENLKKELGEASLKMNTIHENLKYFDEINEAGRRLGKILGIKKEKSIN